jgi:hypothetical protein
MKNKRFFKLLFLLFLILCFNGVFAAKIYVITIQGGRTYWCNSGVCGVCYDFVQVKDSPTQYSKTCTGRGPNCCPKTGIVSVGTPPYPVNIDLIEESVQNQINNGITTGAVTLLNPSGVEIGNYSWNGTVNEDDLIDCTITITLDE